MNVHRLGIFRNVLVYAEATSIADDSDCREGAVEFYHDSPQFRRFLSAALDAADLLPPCPGRSGRQVEINDLRCLLVLLVAGFSTYLVLG